MSLQINLARIDSRLLHGQVTTGWTQVSHPNRIIVVSDSAANDPLRKSLLKEAAPSGVKANVITIAKMIEIWKEAKFDSLKILLLTEDPETMAALIKGGVKIPDINVGNMTFVSGKKTIASNLAVDSKDVAAFKFLEDQGINLVRQMVPSDSKTDLINLLKKADVY